jgi:cellulose synthase/poly-beta-1,6-N-acetylglucosamine synthase-like glycosyltransferase/peptidoglycan/xylan/chitin deacetylase (PgdA/CDA1 family)
MSSRHRRTSPRRRRLPAAHWGLLGVVLVAMLLSLFLQGLTRDVGPTRTGSGPGAAADLPGGGPIVYAGADGELATRGLPDRTVALTFDDGPDPRWTSRVLDVLAAEGVPATFFVTGAAAARSPELVRRTLREGHEVGNHTWSHAQLSTTPAWQRNLELSLAQLGLAGGAEVTSALFRPPYSSEPSAVTTSDLDVLRQVTDAGYVVVLSDRDSKDWSGVGPDEVVERGTPVGVQGSVVLLHDGGGDRAATLAALPRLIDAYRDRGYDFTTVSGGLGLASTAGVQPVSRIGALQGDGLLLALRASDVLVTVVRWAVLPLLVLVLVRTFFVVALARRHVRLSARRIIGAEHLPAVSVLVPAYNEEVGIESAVRSLIGSDYPAPLEVLVIDDGSTDRTAEIVRGLGLPTVRLVQQANGGKAAALRTGTREAAHDVLVMLDGDTVFEPATIRALVQPLRDPRVGAVSGNVKVGNRRGLLGRWQHLEYVAGFNLDRRLLDLLHCITTVPGAAGAFRRDAVEAAGGMSTDTLAEDTDVTMGILRAGYRVVHEERARAWTEAPSTWNDLWKQRYRWAYGTLQVVWKHKRALVERERLGRIALPMLLLFQVVLPLMAPVIDVFVVYGLVSGHARAVLLTWGGYLLLQVLLGAYALRLDKESLRPLWALPLQQVVYRQVMYLVVIQSMVSALSGIRLPWHKLERTGMDARLTAAPEPAAARR